MPLAEEVRNGSMNGRNGSSHRVDDVDEACEEYPSLR